MRADTIAIEAVFTYSAGNGAEHDADAHATRWAYWHRRLLEHYGRTANQLPLLRLDLDRAHDPFRMLASSV